jgi:hypothetical protein
VWAGIIGNCMVGPYLLPDHLNGPTYCLFLQEVLPVLLEDVPLKVRCVTCSFNRMERRHISVHRPNTQFPDRGLGHGGPVPWPVRLLDQNPPDFFLWVHLKEIVYRDLLTDMEDLTAKYYAAVVTIDADMLRHVQLIFHDVRLHVGKCMVDTLNTYCNYHPQSYMSAVFCVSNHCMLLKCCLS